MVDLGTRLASYDQTKHWNPRFMAHAGDIRPDIAIIGTDPAGIEIALGAAALGVPVVLAAPEGFDPDPAEAPALQRLRALGVAVIAGTCRFLDARRLQAGDAVIRPRRFVLATPARVILPRIDGLADLDAPDIRPGSAFLAIGQGRRAVTAACKARQAGADVTLLTQGPLLPDFDADSVRLLRIHLARAGIAVIDGPALEGGTVLPALATGRASRRGHKLVTEAIRNAFEFDRLFIEGHTATFPDEFAPEAAGILGRDDRLILDRSLTTTNRRVLAVGAASGDPDAEVNRSAQVGVALASLLFRRAAPHFPALAIRHASGIPAIAECGLREDDLASGTRGRHRFYRVRLLEDDISGTIKAITTAKGRLLGVSIVAPRPLELIPAFQLAMAQGLALDDLAGLPLPSVSHTAALNELSRLPLRERLASPSTRRLLRLLRVLG